MCSIVMPADYEMLVSHSPPIFSHSPPAASFLSRYESSVSFAPRYKPTKVCSTSSPKRPCLVMRQSDDSSSSGDEDPTSPTRLKKRVVFADDRGMSLTHVRVMTEPSHVPPIRNLRFLAQVVRPEPPVAQKKKPWEVTFSQPASDYLRFRKALDMNKVSLENVIIREGEGSVVGTVKVSNIAFEKEVTIRTSSDNWQTHEDVKCRFVSNCTTNGIYVVYDTFNFRLALPVKANSLEFCVCFRCGGQEFWDNNGSANYKLAKRSTSSSTINPINASYKMPELQVMLQPADVFHTKVDSWSEFASWTHLDTSNPYW